MKTKKDPRHEKRRVLVKQLFAQSFTKQSKLDDVAKKIIKNSDKIDAEIEKSAPQWPIDKLNKVDLAILRLAIHELWEGKTPPKVIIDEAVELAKEYGSENSASFVNGVLGNVYNDEETGDNNKKINEDDNN